MAEEIELLSYLAVFALSVVFSSFAVEKKGSIGAIPVGAVFSWLSTVAWFTLSATHLALTQASSLIILSWMFFALGFIFLLYGFALIFLSFQASRREREWQV